MNHDVHLLLRCMLPERLLEHALKGGAVFARIRLSGERSLYIETDETSAQLLMALCRKYGFYVRLLHQGGKSAWKKRILRRWTLLPAMALCLLICALFLSRIWIVDIRFVNSEALPEIQAHVARCLEESGIHAGISARSIDARILQSRLLAEVQELSYVGVRRQGIRLLAEVSPEIAPPETYVLDHAQDLLAARSGVIESITVYSGEACVQVGDTVLAGDILIRGVESKTKEETTPVSASGRVIARSWYEGSAEASMLFSQATHTGRVSSGCRLQLGKLSLPIQKWETYASEEIQVETLPIVGLFLPLTLEKHTHYETTITQRSQDITLLENRLRALAEGDALHQIWKESPEAEIAVCWTDAQISDNILRIRAVYEIYTDIAITRDALTEEVY